MAAKNPTVLWDEPELASPEWDTELKLRFQVQPLPALSVQAMRDQVLRAQPDVFLLRQQTLLHAGWECLDAWRNELPDMAVVVVMVQHRIEDATFARNALAHGAADFVFATDSAWAMGHRVHMVYQNKASRDFGAMGEVEPPIKTTPLAHLYDSQSGRVSAKLVADYLDVPLKELCPGLERGYAGVHKNPAGTALQKALHPIIKSLEYLRALLPTEADGRIWLNTPHADLDGQTPLAVILDGKGQVVCDMLAAAINGYPS